MISVVRKTFRFLLFSFLTFAVMHVNAQSRADSIQSLIQKSPDDTTRFALIVALGEELLHTAPDSTLALWLRADEEMVRAIEKARGDEATVLLRIRGDLQNNIGFAYLDLGMTKPALECSFRSYEIRRKINDQHGVAESQNNIATFYLRQRDTVDALTWYERSAKEYLAIGDSGGYAFTLINRGLVLNARREYVTAREHFIAAVDILSRLPGMERGYASAVTGLAAAHLGNDQPQEALNSARQGLAIRETYNDQKGISISYVLIGRCYLELNKIDSATWYCTKGFDLARENRSHEGSVTGALTLSQIYERLGDDAKALKYFRIGIQLRDSVSSELAFKDLLTFRLNYEYAKQHSADSTINADKQRLKDLEIAAQNERIESNRQQKYFLIAGLLFLFVFALVLFNRFRITRRQKRLIEIQKKFVDEKQKEMLDSMHYAQRIQGALLAGENLLASHLPEHFVLYRPKDIVSGDFYWAAADPSGERFYLAVCDSTGHGVPGAFMSLLNISFLNEALIEKRITDTAEVFNHVRMRIIAALATDGSGEGGKDGMDGVLCAFDMRSGNIQYTCANNPLWIFRNENGVSNIIELEPDKMPVGKHDRDHVSFSSKHQELKKGDLVLMFTDGYADQFGGEKGKKMMYKRLKETVLASSSESCAKIGERLSESFDAWKGELEQVDDILIVGIRI